MIRLIFLIVSFSQACCSHEYSKGKSAYSDDKIRGIAIHKLFPLLDMKGEVQEYVPDDTRIYYYKDQVMYQTYFSYTDQTIADKPIFSYRYYTFIYTKNNTSGILLDSNNLQTARAVKVDSMLANEWATKVDFKWIFDNNHTTLVLSKQQADGSELEEQYSLKNKKDTLLTGTAFLMYTKNNLSGVPYSFSRELDSIKSRKLFDVRVIQDPGYYKEYNASLGRIEIPWHMEEIKITNEAEISKLFKFEKDYK